MISQTSIEEAAMVKKSAHPRAHERGVSLIETLIVLCIVAILTTIAIPQFTAQRRLLRSTAMTREFSTQLRLTRQLAMSQRAAFTMQYDDSTKEIKVIGPIPVGTVALADPSYPNNTGSSTIVRFPLTQAGLSTSEISYGIPTASELPSGAPAIPTGALGDGVSKTNLASSRVNVTFQPDGSVIDSSGALQNKGLFIYNNRAAQATASAITVLGASGRVKLWRYNTNGNVYAE
jgi:prepilin-type N-terminal cleavage/methylation domain-containing protein